MKTTKQVIGIVGSYRKKGFVDSMVDEVLFAARNQGAEIEKIYLLDQHIEFCSNCRSCMQTPGTERGKCILEDDMEDILKKIEMADSVVIGAPVNCGNLNALTQRFFERCVGYVYWPWGALMPKMRTKKRIKKAVLVSSSAAPEWMGRMFFNVMGSLKSLAKLIGAKPKGTLFHGLISNEDVRLTGNIRKKARVAGEKLAA